MSEKALCKGQAKPPPEAIKLRLYSMRFCPHCAECRLALQAKNVPHDVVNINLRRQPDWFMEMNPAGTVPVLEAPDGKVITDSALIIEHIESLSGQSLFFDKVEELALIEKAKGKLFKSTEDVITGKVQNDLSTDLSDVYHSNMNELEAHLKARGTKFLFRNDKPSFADFCIYPLLNEAQSLCDVLPSLIKPVDMGTHPKLNDYIDAMGASEFGNYVDYFDLVAFNKGVIMDKEYLFNEGLF